LKLEAGSSSRFTSPKKRKERRKKGFVDRNSIQRCGNNVNLDWNFIRKIIVAIVCLIRLK